MDESIICRQNYALKGFSRQYLKLCKFSKTQRSLLASYNKSCQVIRIGPTSSVMAKIRQYFVIRQDFLVGLQLQTQVILLIMGLIINQRMGKHTNDQEFNVETQIKKDYTAISAKKRQKLVEYVIVRQMTIYKAAKRLDIRHPTAKSIIKSYRKAHPDQFLPSKTRRDNEKQCIPDNQNQNRSEKQQINQKKISLPSSQKEHQTHQTTIYASQVQQYSYAWNPYCIFTPFPWNHY